MARSWREWNELDADRDDAYVSNFLLTSLENGSFGSLVGSWSGEDAMAELVCGCDYF